MNNLQAILPYKHYMQSVAFLLCKNTPIDHKDLIQESYLNILKGKEFKKKANIKTWIYSILKNTRHTLLKKEKETHKEAFSPVFYDPRQDWEKERRIDKLYAEIDNLPEKEREIVLLYLKDKSMKEIAQIQNVKRVTVCVRLYRARQNLRVAMAKYK